MQREGMSESDGDSLLVMWYFLRACVVMHFARTAVLFVQMQQMTTRIKMWQIWRVSWQIFTLDNDARYKNLTTSTDLETYQKKWQ